MAKNIEPSLKKIGNYLKLEDAKFVVPEYQRAYSWGIEQCDKLWENVEAFAQENTSSKSRDGYFFGTIILSCQDNDQKLGLIDGQQRTTTFLLLLKALLMNVNEALEIEKTVNDDESKELLRGLKERRKDLMERLYQVERENISGMPDKAEDEKIYTDHKAPLYTLAIRELYKDELDTILAAPDFETAEEKVVKIKYQRKDNRYTHFFQNFKYFYNKAKKLKTSQLNKFTKVLLSECEVIEIRSWKFDQAIDMFNSLNSDGMPLTDADIISAKLYEAAGKQEKIEEFKEIWEDLTKLTDQLEGMKIASIDKLLMQRMYAERAKAGEMKNNTTTPGVRRYFEGYDTKNASTKPPRLMEQPINFAQSLTDLANHWKESTTYPTVQVLMKLNDNARVFLGEYLQRFGNMELPREDTGKLAEGLLRMFAILEVVETGYSSTPFKSFLFNESAKIVAKNVAASEIVADIGRHIQDNWEAEKIQEALMGYNGNSLVYLNDFLVAKEDGVAFSLDGKYDIEHIMPASGKNKSSVRSDAKIEDEIEFKGIVNKLGNKMVLESEINRSIGDEWFRSKIEGDVRDKMGYRYSHFPMANRLVKKYGGQEHPTWTKDDILSATEEAAKRLTKFVFGAR